VVETLQVESAYPRGPRQIASCGPVWAHMLPRVGMPCKAKGSRPASTVCCTRHAACCLLYARCTLYAVWHTLHA
jgi:hypothetical protein